MDLRFFLVSFPFLLALLFTLILLIKWECTDDINSQSDSKFSLIKLNYSNGFINKNYLSREYLTLNKNNFLLNIIIFPTITFLLLIFTTIYTYYD